MGLIACVIYITVYDMLRYLLDVVFFISPKGDALSHMALIYLNAIVSFLCMLQHGLLTPIIDLLST